MSMSFDDLQYAAGLITNPTVGYLLHDVCERIALAGKLTATAANQIELMQRLGVNFDVIERELIRRLKRSQNQIKELFTDYAKSHYEGEYERLKLSYIPFEENKALQNIVKAYTAMAQDDFSNATQTKGGKVRLRIMDGSGAGTGKGRVLPWRDFYVNACDDVNQKVVTGAMSYNEAVREASKNLAAKGIRTIDYESGRSISLEAGMRRNIMGFLGLMAEEISWYNHDEMGADGFETSAHELSAPDHEPHQGKQFSDTEWLRLNGRPERKLSDGTVLPEVVGEIVKNGGRRFMELNCGHIVSSIFLGVNEPQYTKERLQEFRDDNAKGFIYKDFKGSEKHYTGFKTTQHMRYIETNIRNWRRDYVVAVNTLNPDQTMIASSHIVKWMNEYKRFSAAAKLKMQEERYFAVGYAEARKKAATLGFAVPRAG